MCLGREVVFEKNETSVSKIQTAEGI